MRNENLEGADSTSFQRRDLVGLWFTSTARVDRQTYLLSALLLTALRYVVEIAVHYAQSGQVLDPLAFWSPFLGSRFPGTGETLTALLLVSIPFLWVWASLSIRRSTDAGFGAYIGLLVFVPIINWIVITMLATLPSDTEDGAGASDDLGSGWWVSLLSVAVAGLFGLVAVTVSVFGFESYGAALFIATPLLQGFIVGYACGRDGAGIGRAIALSQMMVIITGLMLLSLALEGLVCLAMAYPIAAVLALLGAVLGHAVGHVSRTQAVQLTGILLTFPALLGAETQRTAPPLREVVSVVEIDAPAEAVWPQVVAFSELPPVSEWVFRLGIAHPIRARIEGEGVGAVRYCEFSTGPFVEPITHWDAPRRLAFDVRSQPEPMHEWSPYQHVDAPHLLHTLRSKRGEFRLVPLAGGRTRLEGSTWYELEMFPQAYWSLYSDLLIHAIHHRVLDHIKERAEGGRLTSALGGL